MKRSKILISLLAILLLVAVFFLADRYVFNSNIVNNPLDNILPSATPTPEPEKVSVTLVVVSKFTNTKTNFTLKQIQNRELVTTKTSSEFIPESIEADIVDEADILTELDQDKFALLLPFEVKPEYKTLIINNQNPWSKSFNLDKYPFKKEVLKEDGAEFALDSESVASMFAGGEIIASRAVDRIGLNQNNNYTYLFDFLKDDISDADIALALLENPLIGDPTPCTGCTVFRSDERNAQGFKQVGFDILAAAGNHAGDGGQEGYARTLEVLKEAKIQVTGIGKSEEETLVPAIKKVGNKRFGVVSADDVATFYWNKGGNYYGTNGFSKIGTYKELDTERIEELKQIKQEYKIDYLVVYMSWGIEYTNNANDYQQDMAHMLIDNGAADLIVSSHPHWVQNIEFYKGVPIIYSLGNFIFDQTHTDPTRQGMVANFHYYMNELKSIELIPIQACGYHQTSNNLTDKYLAGDLSLEQVYNTNDTEGCVYWQPKKLDQTHPSYETILERVFEYTDIK